jgi:hypothetical protein
MTNAIESDGFVLKILNQSTLEVRILVTLKQNVESLDYDFTKLLVRGGAIAGNVNLSIAAPAQTFFDIVTAIESTL